MNCGCNNEETQRVNVTLKFLRTELLYDVKNYAHVEADVMGEPGDSKVLHAQHQLADIGEKGNIDRVNRILAVVHPEVTEMLYPYTKQEVVEEEMDDRIVEPEEYVIELSLPETMSRTSVKLLSKLIHEYMVYRVMADWLTTTNPTAAQAWTGKADIAKKLISSTIHNRRKTFTRKMQPF